MTAFSYIQNNVYVKIKPSKLQGVGVFALRDIPAGVSLFEPWNGQTGLYPIPEEDLLTLPKELYLHIKDMFLYAPDFPKDTSTYVQLTNGCHWIYTTPYYFVNSDASNSNMDKDTLKSTTYIKKGNEILSNYKRYERLKSTRLL